MTSLNVELGRNVVACNCNFHLTGKILKIISRTQIIVKCSKIVRNWFRVFIDFVFKVI